MASVYKRGGKSNRKAPWYVSWFDHEGKRREKCTRTTDKATAERIAKKLEADTALRREGVIDPLQDDIKFQSQRSIESHLTDYECKLRTAGRTEKHIRSTTNFIRWISEHANFSSPIEISAEGVNRYAQSLREKGRAARTIAAHLSAIKAFTRWLYEFHKIPRDPLTSVKKPNPVTDRRHERRMLLPEEWEWLRFYLREAPLSEGMIAPERTLLYSTAIQTGLRSNELRTLARGSLFLDARRPYVIVKAKSTKNHKDAKQYVLPELANQLRICLVSKTPKAPVFRLPDETRLARMLRTDLEGARRKWLEACKSNPEERVLREQSDFLLAENYEGESLDFHSLRHTCGAWLAMAGTHPKVVQSVMRHSSITLTMDTYGHLFPGQEADAVDSLNSFLQGRPTVHQATGADDKPIEMEQQLIQRSGRRGTQPCAPSCDDEEKKGQEQSSPKPLQIADLGDSMDESAALYTSSGGGTRTPDTRIMIPLL